MIVATKGADTFGYAALDGLFFDDSPLLPNCDTLPADAAVKPPTPPPPPIQDCDFEQDFCTWHTVPADPTSETFAWRRTTGSEQNNVVGPEDNHDGKKDSKRLHPNRSQSKSMRFMQCKYTAEVKQNSKSKKKTKQR